MVVFGYDECCKAIHWVMSSSKRTSVPILTQIN